MLVTFRVKNIVSFCVKKLLHFALKSCYILRQTLLHFGLMLHFVSKVVTFRVNVTFCGVTQGALLLWINAMKRQYYKHKVTVLFSLINPWLFFFAISQGKFSVKPSVFVTSKHYNPGLKRDAASVWIEDVTKSSCKVCMRELQNYAGSHRDIFVVSIMCRYFKCQTIMHWAATLWRCAKPLSPARA